MLRANGDDGDARWAVTDRSGGVSPAPYASLNLGGHVGDDPTAVDENRSRLAAAVGVAASDLRFMHQVHGAAVAEVGRDTSTSSPAVDALLTREPGVALAVLVADCVPVVLTGPGLVAVAHAGRRGVHGGVVAATVAAAERLGVAPAALTATVGPAVCGACYEVPVEMRDEVAADIPAARSTTRAGTAGLDLRAGVAAQLSDAGVRAVELLPGCTVEDATLFSYRRDGVTGRFAAVAWLAA